MLRRKGFFWDARMVYKRMKLTVRGLWALGSAGFWGKKIVCVHGLYS